MGICANRVPNKLRGDGVDDEPKLVKVETDHEGAALIWVLFLSIVLFYGDPDLFDLIFKLLAKLAA